MKKENLTIDFLRGFERIPAYFGLGFIQLKLNDTERLHFYHKDLPVLVEEPHTHRYNFTSYILQGRFNQRIYWFSENPTGDHVYENETCDPYQEISVSERTYGYLHQLLESDYSEGDSYTIDVNTLHTVKASDNAITFLRRGTPFKTYAGVIRKVGIQKVCPFSKPIPENECWELIDDMISSNGYHIRNIPKGIVGEPTKILEEAYEIIDAHEQGVHIMAQLEMSDLYGALDRYREKYYPHLTMHDLDSMYRLTRRAFETGSRT